MANKIRTNTVLRHNYREMIFVFAAFALLVLVAYLFIGRILRERLRDRAEEVIYTAGANARVSLSEVETTLLNSRHIVQDMIERDAPQQEILDFLITTTRWMRQRDQGLLDFKGIYGYIHGKLYDSIDMNPGDDYIPQMGPWYQAAVRSRNTVAYTAPYIDWRTGDPIVSAVHNIDTESGDIAGILVVDFTINRLAEYICSLTLSGKGYGMLMNQNMTLIAHPDSTYAGRQLHDLGGSYSEIARTLRSGENVFARRIKDTDGHYVIVFFTRIFNGWYVGSITRYFDFYHDINVAASILVLLGLVLSVALCFMLLRLSMAKMRADEDSRSKSSFLASMSHEIRTPMNAITGMAELLLRGELSEEARGYAQDIKQAGNNLISIINDILDFSKIEAGKLEITPAKYQLSSLLNDTVNIIRMWITEKPIRFYTNIDGNIPNNLIGDEVRLRQILLNLLSNAVKYSEKGFIILSVTQEIRSATHIGLKITIADSGKGIKPEDTERLFGDFVQVDAGKNQGIVGTGLGLAITKRLCLAMGGYISVESEYGKGSAFTVSIPQGIESETPFAAVEEAENKRVLVYESRTGSAKSVCWSLENLHVPHVLVANYDDFSIALQREKWDFVFSGCGLYEKIRPAIEQNDSAFPSGKKPQLALMVDWGMVTHISNVHLLYLPVQSLSIANILNGRTDSKGYENSGICTETRLIISGARILVVDDIATNLKVTKGLLAPYHCEIDTCLSGAEAIEMVKRKNYDIVFMDHMMPEMDGIEATAIIRDWEKEKARGEKSTVFLQETPKLSEVRAEEQTRLPIIALTANAVLGMREVFLEKGFNDFLAKPIELSKLDDILDRWISKEKKVITDVKKDSGDASNSLLLVIPGLDIQRGIKMTGGTEARYRSVLSLFNKDARERLPLLQVMPAPDSLNSFIIQVHALKSASASIGASEISSLAAELEAAGKAGDMAFIGKQLPVFVKGLSELADNICTSLGLDAGTSDAKNSSPGLNENIQSSLTLLLNKLAAALESKNIAEIDRFLEQLAGQPKNSKINAVLEQISDEVLVAEYDRAAKILEKLNQG